MATAKKTVKATSKKTAAKRAPAKSPTKTKVTHRASHKQADMRSFQVADNVPFMRFELTVQTLYWAILCGLVLALGVWVMSINIQVQQIYDQVDAANQTISQTP